MLSDIDIAQKATLQRIADLAQERLGIAAEHLEPYGHYKAKIHLNYLRTLSDRPDGKLILVTAISPTPAGEGKTTTTVGLGDALNRVVGPTGKKAMICLREPSLGPVFGLKGGAAGGGYAQVVPMEDINLHFTGDFSAIALAHNLLSALIDNHIHHGNELGIDVRRIGWKRVVDMNDRALRDITVGLGGPANGFPRQDGFDIVVASEIMAIFCLATSLGDLKERIGNIIIGTTAAGKPIHARDLKAHGASRSRLMRSVCQQASAKSSANRITAATNWASRRRAVSSACMDSRCCPEINPVWAIIAASLPSPAMMPISSRRASAASAYSGKAPMPSLDCTSGTASHTQGMAGAGAFFHQHRDGSVSIHESGIRACGTEVFHDVLQVRLIV